MLIFNVTFFSFVEPLPLLIILAATISGVLLSIVILVIAMTCVRITRRTQPGRGESPDVSAWPRGSSYSSSSDSDDPSQSNITSSCTVDDADDSFESLPVNYSAFIKSENIPDLKSSYQGSSEPVINIRENSILVRDGIRQSCNYIVYNHHSGNQEPHHQEGPGFANPYVQSTSPMTVAQGADSRTATASPFYTNITPYKERDSAVIRYLEGEVTAQQLDHMKLGTHV